MSTRIEKNYKIIVVGSGLPSLNFIDSFLKKNKKIDVISPDFDEELDESNVFNNHLFEIFPTPEIKKRVEKVKNYFISNNLQVDKNCKILGSLEFGGLSNYWGLQVDKDIIEDIKHLKKSTVKSIKHHFYNLLKSSGFIGEFKLSKKLKFKNDYEIPEKLEDLIKQKDKNYSLTKSILAFFTNSKKKVKLGDIKEKKSKFISSNFFKKSLKSKNIKFHNYYVEKIYKERNKIILLCKNSKGRKKFIADKVVLGCGTIVTTKLILDFLKINKEVRIKHHPRLLSAFLSKIKIPSTMDFTPSLLQIKNKKKNDRYIADIRPGNSIITDAIIDLYKFLLPLKFFINHIKEYLIFSNILLDSKYSDLYMKVEKNSVTKIYSKNQPISFELKKKNKNIFRFLLKNKIIYPIYKTSFPGTGAEYHYFGTIPINSSKSKLSVNENCQLKSNPNIYIVDGSVFDFRVNKYPLALIMANARRIGNNIK